MKFSSVIIILFFLGSCTSGVPRDILPQDKLGPIIFDLLRADEYLNNFILKDTLLNREKEAIKLYQQVFHIHKITSKDFFRSYKYYQAHPDNNKQIVDSLNAFVIRKRNKPDSINLKAK